MRQYEGKVDKMCAVEQDLVMGVDVHGEPIKDVMKNLVPLLIDGSIHSMSKIRIILLYILAKNGSFVKYIYSVLQPL